MTVGPWTCVRYVSEQLALPDVSAPAPASATHKLRAPSGVTGGSPSPEGLAFTVHYNREGTEVVGIDVTRTLAGDTLNMRDVLGAGHSPSPDTALALLPWIVYKKCVSVLTLCAVAIGNFTGLLREILDDEQRFKALERRPGGYRRHQRRHLLLPFGAVVPSGPQRPEGRTGRA